MYLRFFFFLLVQPVHIMMLPAKKITKKKKKKKKKNPPGTHTASSFRFAIWVTMPEPAATVLLHFCAVLCQSAAASFTLRALPVKLPCGLPGLLMPGLPTMTQTQWDANTGQNYRYRKALWHCNVFLWKTRISVVLFLKIAIGNRSQWPVMLSISQSGFQCQVIGTFRPQPHTMPLVNHIIAHTLDRFCTQQNHLTLFDTDRDESVSIASENLHYLHVILSNWPRSGDCTFWILFSRFGVLLMSVVCQRRRIIQLLNGTTAFWSYVAECHFLFCSFFFFFFFLNFSSAVIPIYLDKLLEDQRNDKWFCARRNPTMHSVTPLIRKDAPEIKHNSRSFFVY